MLKKTGVYLTPLSSLALLAIPRIGSSCDTAKPAELSFAGCFHGRLSPIETLERFVRDCRAHGRVPAD